MFKKNIKKSWLLVIIVFCSVLLGGGYYFFKYYNNENNTVVIFNNNLNPAQLAEWQEKLKLADEAIKNNPSYTSYEQLALARQMLGDINGAIEAYNKAIEFDSKNYFSYISLGDIYQDKGEYQKAEEYYAKAIQYRAEENVGYLKLGELYYQKMPEKKDEAEKIWRQGVFKSNIHFPITLRLADYFYETGKLEEAEGFYQAYLNYDPDDERAREMLYKVNRERSLK